MLKAGGQRPDLAVDWLYESGSGYLDVGDIDNAMEALAAIRQLSPSNELAHKLGQEIGHAPVDAPQKDQGPISAGTTIGTGWPVARGYVVTNNHVVSGGDEVVLVTTRGQEVRAFVAVSDEVHDLALLRVDDWTKSPTALPLSRSRPRLGMRVIGFSRLDVMGWTPKLSEGIVSSVNGLYDDPSRCQISVPIESGNSGGPLLNMKGKVVGVVASMLATYDPATGGTHALPGINYAVKAEFLENPLALAPQTQYVINELPAASGNLEDLAGRGADSMLIVMVR